MLLLPHPAERGSQISSQLVIWGRQYSQDQFGIKFLIVLQNL